MARRLGWLGPVIVLVGIAAAAFGTWFMIHERPKAGAVIDTIAIDAGHSFVIRAEAGGDRNFVELRDGDRVVWQAMVPPYGGRPGAPGIGWSPTAVSIRVIRDHRAEVFALQLADGAKLGGIHLAPDHGEIIQPTSGPVTLTDHERSYEIVSGAGWNQLVAIDLASGLVKWKQELGAGTIDAGGIDTGGVWIQHNGHRRQFRAIDGVESNSGSSS